MTALTRTLRAWTREMPDWLLGLSYVVGAVALALVAHRVIVWVARRATRARPESTAAVFVERVRKLLRWLLIAIALAAVQPALDLTRGAATLWARLSALLVPGLMGWCAIVAIGTVIDVMMRRADISVEDNLRARRRRTRLGILRQIIVSLILLVTICTMLMTIPSVRSLGVTLAASAGLAGLAVGAAAQPALKNLIAGFQMIFTEPIRIDDVVIMDGEWGRIEEIRLTYVVVKIWDERRLVVPVSKFLEQSFQNWTRQSSALLGSVFWYLDPAVDVERLRAKLGEIVTGNPRWDKRFWNLQVTDTKPDGSIELRGLMTARDASTAFDLRCDVREALLAYIRAEMPEALLRRRVLVEGETAAVPDPERLPGR
ncbi:mechanosensitive ion channel family protein [Sphingomonas sp. BK069]|uniref:mechanosensitive ion channel family protein n=1 Tax=Sphingomonas sp. BK069 TaxID=2586979 RepID=UPI00185B6E15|nr:mechanosensitive ion channel family protein [Sphingomonas sp. BK069]MBB3349196.1 small-conductance mechanosensitive channel [Sphingomonas sp. BK069]